MNTLAHIARSYLAPLTFGLGCFIAGDMAGGSYPWAAHMPYVAVMLGAVLAALICYSANLIEEG